MKPGCHSGKIEIIRCASATDAGTVFSDVRRGLTAPQKHLPSKYFYDSRGSALFERICALPEYYLTRTELALLRSVSREIMRDVQSGSLIELGSGANWKIRTLLDAADGALGRIRYVPVDVCEQALRNAAENLLDLYPGLTVSGRVADFHGNLDILAVMRPKLILFFGSTIGNLTPDESGCLLNALSGVMHPGDRLVIGMDLIKEKKILEAAYNDRQGVTAAFNRNILLVLNRETGSCFDPAQFDHVAFFNEEAGQIEMHLRAVQDLCVPVRQLGLEVRLRRGETIRTEISRKFRRETIDTMARFSGLKISAWHTDPREWFGLVEMVPDRAA